MKKAPKKFRKGYAEGGETIEGDPKKDPTLKLTTAQWDELNKKHGNIEHPRGDLTRGYKRYYDPKLFNVSKDEASGGFSTLDASGNSVSSPDIYDYEYKASVKPKPKTKPLIYGNYIDGKQVPYQGEEIKKAKGGTVMKKAPCKMKKGGTC